MVVPQSKRKPLLNQVKHHCMLVWAFCIRYSSSMTDTLLRVFKNRHSQLGRLDGWRGSTLGPKCRGSPVRGGVWVLFESSGCNSGISRFDFFLAIFLRYDGKWISDAGRERCMCRPLNVNKESRLVLAKVNIQIHKVRNSLGAQLTTWRASPTTHANFSF